MSMRFGNVLPLTSERLHAGLRNIRSIRPWTPTRLIYPPSFHLSSALQSSKSFYQAMSAHASLPNNKAPQSFSTTVIFGITSRKASLSLSIGSKPSLFSAVSEMYRPIVPQARIPRPTVRRVRGERLLKDLVGGVSDRVVV